MYLRCAFGITADFQSSTDSQLFDFLLVMKKGIGVQKFRETLRLILSLSMHLTCLGPQRIMSID